MPRGSRPGERRGGRQRGTPNKKTVLRNAAISAAAAGSNLSPLDLLLGLMREPESTPRASYIGSTRDPALRPFQAARLRPAPCRRQIWGSWQWRQCRAASQFRPASENRQGERCSTTARRWPGGNAAWFSTGGHEGCGRAPSPSYPGGGHGGAVRSCQTRHGRSEREAPSKPRSSSMIPMALRSSPPSHGRFGMTHSGWSFCGPLKDILIETRLLQRWPTLKLASPK